MRLLDLFCGAGGAAMGYHEAGFDDIVGVDNRPQPNYPFGFVLADAMTYPLGGFDVIHASPPCQAFSSKTRNPAVHPDLVTPLRRRLIGSSSNPGPCYDGKAVYVIENVVGAPLVDPAMLCGSLFGLRVRRHRLFESNSDIMQRPCEHFWQDNDPIFRLYDHGRWFTSGIVHVFGNGGGKGKEHWPLAMGIDWMTGAELTQAIPPAYTEYIGRAFMAALERKGEE